MEREIALEMRGVSKYFGSVVANKNVNLKVYKGEILAVLGENGSGKTTLMNMISGIYFPDEGQTFVNGEEAVIRSPQDAFAYKIGMIHQHFKLVDVFTAAQNIVLGVKNEPKPVDDKKNAFSKFFAKIGRKMESGLYKKKEVAAQVKEIADKYGFEIDPNKKIYNMSVSEKQTVEIVKVLYRGANVLILDEPTAVLTPQETEKLFAVLRKMKEDGKSIIIITHKLNEVLAVSDRVAILRKGESVGEIATKDADENKLTELMVGKKVALNIERSTPENCEDRLEIKGLNLKNHDGVKVLDHISFILNREDKVALVGPNEQAKTVLFKILAGEMEPDEGSYKWGLTTSQSYFPKDNTKEFDNDDTIVDWLTQYSPVKDVTYVRGFLGRMLFAGEDGVKKVRVLSGGEKVRCMLSKMMISGANVLMFDEPTDHLDMESITALNNGMIKFPGVLLFSSRDHQIVETTANRIMEIINGQLIDKITTYDEYLESDEMARKRFTYTITESEENDD